MTVSDAGIISRPRNNTSAEPIDSQATAPRLWDHGRSAGLLPVRDLPTTGGRVAARWGGWEPALTPRSPGNQRNVQSYACPVSIPALLEWRAVFHVAVIPGRLLCVFLEVWSSPDGNSHTSPSPRVGVQQKGLLHDGPGLSGKLPRAFEAAQLLFRPHIPELLITGLVLRFRDRGKSFSSEPRLTVVLPYLFEELSLG